MIIKLALQLGPWLIRLYDFAKSADPETRRRFWNLVTRWGKALKMPSRFGRIEARLDATEATLSEITRKPRPGLSQEVVADWALQISSLRAGLQMVQSMSGRIRSARTKLIERQLSALEEKIFFATLGVGEGGHSSTPSP